MINTGSENGLIDATNRVEMKLKKEFSDIIYTFFETDRCRDIHEYYDLWLL